MNAIATPAITPDDLLRMPDEGRGFELVDGQLRTLNMSNESSYVGGEILHLLKSFINPRGLGYVFMADNGFQCFPNDPDRVRRADVSFIAAARLTPEQYHSKGHCPVCPDLIVEVVSPNDLVTEVTTKRKEWLAAGAKLVWVVDPDDRTVSVYRPDQTPRILLEKDTVTGDPVLPGFAVSVADLFKLPGGVATS
jgi:Uma2 family endonuclease